MKYVTYRQFPILAIVVTALLVIARAGNAKTFFLDDHFDEVLASLETRTQTSAWTAFARVKKVCMSCHEAENIGYMNMQPLFNLSPP